MALLEPEGVGQAEYQSELLTRSLVDTRSRCLLQVCTKRYREISGNGTSEEAKTAKCEIFQSAYTPEN